MKSLRKLTALFCAAVIAVISAFACGVTAGATSLYELISELKKYKITSDTKLDSSVYGYYKTDSDHLVIYISGLDALEAAQIEETANSDGYELSMALVFDNGIGLGYENSNQAMLLGKTYVTNVIRSASFTHAGSVYKFMIEVETSDLMLETLNNSKAAAVSIRALNTASQIKTYYNGKKVLYIPFSSDDKGITDITTLSFSGLTSRVYTGKEVAPEVTVKDGSYILRNGTDYRMSYLNNVKVGIATAVITGKGSYSGTKKLKFKIVPKGTTITKFTLNRDKLTVNWEDVENVDKYYIYMSEDKGLTYTLLGSVKAGTTKFVTKFPAGSKYTFRVRTSKTVDGKKYYGPYSRAVMVR
ncbi:MAG: hypothetical protein IJT87_00335 [Ruminiclostridium sp.]|nr:hypothetical protein [Ruminiclostridium sp.]